MSPVLPVLLLCLPATAGAQYFLSPLTRDSGGGHGGSAAYTLDSSGSPGGAGSSSSYVSLGGFAGQLDEATSLALSLSPSSLAETASGQLQASLLSSAGFFTALPPGGVVWTILDGPLSGITSGGLVTADQTWQTTGATVQGLSAGLTGTLTFSVMETIPDNFGIYAGDRLPDWWQVRYFGLSGPAAGQAGDPDRDGLSNLLEFAFGTDPSSAATGSGNLVYSGGVLSSRGQPLPVVTNIPNSVDFRVIYSRRRDYLALGLRYQVQFSPDLLTWTTSTALPVVVAQDAEYEAAGVPWPFFLNGRKARFYRMVIDFVPTP